MRIQEILQLIPHRYPFLLIDEVVDFIAGKSLKAIKNVTADEPFFAGHFFDNPMMPSILIPEAMAQTLAILASKTMQAQNIDVGEGVFLFAGIDNAHFLQSVIPGDQLMIETVLGKSRSNFWKCSSTASVGNKVVCTADLVAAYSKSKQ
ncbi:MAG: 3-hydroxyacyl-ACP dehydratase FabZ [Gammaproteobacteria bacterium]